MAPLWLRGVTVLMMPVRRSLPMRRMTAPPTRTAVAVGDFALGLEVVQVAHDGNLLPCTDGAAHFAVDIGECGASWRAYLGIVEGAALLVESLLKDAVL